MKHAHDVQPCEAEDRRNCLAAKATDISRYVNQALRDVRQILL